MARGGQHSTGTAALFCPLPAARTPHPAPRRPLPLPLPLPSRAAVPAIETTRVGSLAPATRGAWSTAMFHVKHRDTSPLVPLEPSPMARAAGVPILSGRTATDPRPGDERAMAAAPPPREPPSHTAIP
ncbi:hypothetical protein ACFSEO_05965 [Agromyces cerinus subsp. nitratus]|uniref:hypothetical protein n=1 Tax=Agromyces cerinus TaxID=33878 RepID=UPI0036339D8B